MTGRATVYVGSVILVGIALSALSLLLPAPETFAWVTFGALVGLATISHLFKARGPRHEAWQTNLIAYFAGVLLLPPPLFVLLVIIPHLVEWTKERLTGSSSLRSWHIQPFNIATHLVSGTIASGAAAILYSGATILAPVSIPAVVAALVIYAGVNRLLMAGALILGRGVDWRESGLLDLESFVSDIVLLCLGYIVAILWNITPWLLLPALSPLVLIYRALTVPQLKKEAQTDTKTGLCNARHFARLYKTEMERAQHLGHPLSVIMADLDLLRNINNHYGHLAGDAVLVGVGRIIQDTLRKGDTGCRFGGEEFAMILPRTERAEAQARAEQIRQAVEAASFPVSAESAPVHITMSLGVATFPEDATIGQDLIHEADVAVYQAKLKGRNQVVCAADIPHSIRLEGIPNEARTDTKYGAAFAPKPAGSPSTRPQSTPPVPSQPAVSTSPVPEKSALGSLGMWRWLFVGAVILAGVVAALIGTRYDPMPNLAAIGLFGIMIMIAELFQMDLYGDGSVSVSVAVSFATAVIAGFHGAIVASALIVLVHLLRRRPAFYKTAFSWSAHVLAMLTPILIIRGPGIALTMSNFFLLVGLTIPTSLLYYGIETGLIAGAISLSEKRPFIKTWREQYGWLLYHYPVLCVMGMLMAIAYFALGTLGVVVFTFPILMMRYAQSQYIARTETSTQELKRMNEELTRANRQVVAASRAMRHLNQELFLTLSKIIDARDPFVSGHATKVADYATAIARELTLPTEQIERLQQAAFLHDIGKVAISEQVLYKPGPLTESEYDYMMGHAALGADFLETCQGLRHLAPFVRHHHEKWDGTGYPDRLRGDQMALEARILALADAVDAMASDRPYHHAMSLDEIVAELERCSGKHFDPEVVKVFVRIAQREGSRLVTNSAGEVARHLAARPDRDYTNAWLTPQPDPGAPAELYDSL